MYAVAVLTVKLWAGADCALLRVQAFLSCMKEHDATHFECKHLSAEYLKCRMDKCVYL